jgi:hypothetical protein
VCTLENIKIGESCVSTINKFVFELVSKITINVIGFLKKDIKVIHKEHEILFALREKPQYYQYNMI